MTVLLTGAAGFLGSHVAEALEQAGHEVRPFDTRYGDDARSLSALLPACKGCDAICHVAANTTVLSGSKHPDRDFLNGAVLTYNVLEAARLTGNRRVLYASSGSVYGNRGPVDLVETLPLKPNSPYAANKVASEALLEGYCRAFGMTGTAFRFSNIVGPRQTHGVAYDLVRKLRADPSRLEVLGDGWQRKSYVHATHAASAMIQLLNRPHASAFEVYNVASDDYLSVREIAEMVCNQFDCNPDIVYEREPVGWIGDIPAVYLRNAKLRATGWDPVLTSREAVALSIESIIEETAHA